MPINQSTLETGQYATPQISRRTEKEGVYLLTIRPNLLNLHRTLHTSLTGFLEIEAAMKPKGSWGALKHNQAENVFSSQKPHSFFIRHSYRITPPTRTQKSQAANRMGKVDGETMTKGVIVGRPPSSSQPRYFCHSCGEKKSLAANCEAFAGTNQLAKLEGIHNVPGVVVPGHPWECCSSCSALASKGVDKERSGDLQANRKTGKREGSRKKIRKRVKRRRPIAKECCFFPSNGNSGEEVS
ncbi:hypothetical protein BJ508DRAFT_312366 [Ascobolus immersus RN42]|uniref:Uncharacterized protein n=1 Tax=Ascobolus immersus RN42 TaxID=1160509 RepID=A0A3N4HME5_ASCIM|nr:hypothetical protein BJ508DRAFT_312366 [Ascobolus immersus RN42]